MKVYESQDAYLGNGGMMELWGGGKVKFAAKFPTADAIAEGY